MRTLRWLAVLGFAMFVVGCINDGPLDHRIPVNPALLVSIGAAMIVSSAILGFMMVSARFRTIDEVRWQEGTVTFRTVEPGKVDKEFGRVRFSCEVELNPTARIARVGTWIVPPGPKRLVVGKTMRCLIDRVDIDVSLRVFPWVAAWDAPLPSGRELLFYEEKAKA
jgi:hypothetical protein